METKSLIITHLEKLLHFFEKHQVSGWTQRSKQAIERIQKGQDYKTVLNEFSGTGPGSLTDLDLGAENRHLIVGSTEKRTSSCKYFPQKSSPLNTASAKNILQVHSHITYGILYVH